MKLASLEQTYEANFFLLRSPLLEYDYATAFLFGIGTSPHSLDKRLKEIYAHPTIKEAIYLSSPDLYSQLLRYLTGEIKDKRSIRKIQQSLMQYFVRMCSRCTPFGLFAACSPGNFGDHTNIVFEGMHSLKRFARFDMDSICRMVEALKSDKEVRSQLKLYPNTSLYRSGDKFKYIEYSLDKSEKQYVLQEVPYAAILNRSIAIARSGIAFRDLVQEIVSNGYDPEEAHSYVNDLIDSQILISNIEPVLTDPTYPKTLIKSGLPGELANNIIETLNNGIEVFDAINDCPDKISSYQKIAAKAGSLNLNIAKEKLIQVDVYRKPTICELSTQVKQRTLEAVSILKTLYGYRIRETRLEYFKRAFFEKYEYASVGICEALDSITGLGFEALSSEDAYRVPTNVVYDKIMQYKLQKYAEGIYNADGSVTINQGDLDDIEDNDLPTAHSFSVTISVFEGSGNEQILIKSAGSSSGVNLLSRFCHMDEQLTLNVRKITTQEQQLESGKVIAEIIHLPESRLGNILIRPKIRDYEIPYLAQAHSQISETISINDLYLRMEKGHLILFSKMLKKEILPRLSTAHNYTKKSLPIYHLLCELQHQGMQSGFGWHWGFLENQSFLPRVIYKGIILSLAKWNLEYRSLKDILETKDDDLVKLNFAKYRQALKIPVLVYLSDFDNDLLVNLDNIICLRYLGNFLKKRGNARLHEVIWEKYKSPIMGPNGQYINEIIIPFIRKKDGIVSQKPLLKIDINTTVPRKFYPGSQWVCFKLYFNVESTNKILASIYKFLSTKTGKKTIDKWFFVNYADPKFHLRVRFVLYSKDFSNDTTNAFTGHMSSYIKSGIIQDIAIVPYIRELERYGPASITVCEQIFSWSSHVICNRLKQSASDRETLLFHIKASFVLLGPIKHSIHRAHLFCKSSYTGFAAEFNLDQQKPMREFLIQEYRDLSKDIRSSLTALLAFPSPEYSFPEEKKLKISDLITDLFEYEKRFYGDFDEVIRSIIHMHINRAYYKNQRLEEMKIYCYLTKYFASELALMQKYHNESVNISKQD